MTLKHRAEKLIFLLKIFCGRFKEKVSIILIFFSYSMLYIFENNLSFLKKLEMIINKEDKINY